jgi:diguanylate cyclase (GGDEF)-like protein
VLSGQDEASAVRVRAARDMIVPGLILGYALATLGGPHRPAMIAVAGVLLAVPGLFWWRASVLARSRARSPIRYAAEVLQLLGAGLVSLLDGGVASPAGAMPLFALVIIALRTRPAPFAALAAVGAATYATVAVLGAPGPPGYALACLLGFGGVSYLCLRHAVALASLRRRLAWVSRTDPLTGVLNRRGFDERLESVFAGAVRTGAPMTLVLADLDLFKQVNDRYGHQTGDRLLVSLADRLGQRLGVPDAVGRIGGDEFAVVLAGVGPQEAAAVVRRLREDVGGLLPASFGFACFPADGDSTAGLRRAADARVYVDKVSRDRHPPSADAVAEVIGTGRGSGPSIRVSARERRRRSVIDIGWMSMLGSGCGLLYAAAFAGGHPHRVPIAVLAALLGLAGAGFVIAADRVSRLTWARQFVFLGSLIQVAFIGGMAALDGGVTGVPALALLAPVPLIALSSPLRVSLPVGGLFAVVYLGVAGLVGASSGWYVTLHLGGTAVVCAICAAQGREAGRQRRQLTELSRRDALTGLLNRRGFGERCSDELAGRGGEVALLIVDLDDFKQVNDRFGHEAGDDLLRWVADTLTAHLDPWAAVGRLGGDEFVVLLTGPSAARAPAVADGVRAALAARTGAGLGLAAFGRDGDDFESLYACADARLYADKKARPVFTPPPR